MPRRLHQLRADYLINKPDYPPRQAATVAIKYGRPRLWISSAASRQQNLLLTIDDCSGLSVAGRFVEIDTT